MSKLDQVQIGDVISRSFANAVAKREVLAILTLKGKKHFVTQYVRKKPHHEFVNRPRIDSVSYLEKMLGYERVEHESKHDAKSKAII